MKQITDLPSVIMLCGFMGTGKSTIGQNLALKLGLRFSDLDDRIEKMAGRSISRIFAEEGEETFRSLERRYLREVLNTYEGILALGGGTLQNQEIVDRIKMSGLLIFIETPFSVIFQRLLKNKDRPLLLDEKGKIKKTEVLEQELHQLYKNRLKYYRQADITVQNDATSSVEETTAALVRKIRNHVSHH